SGYQGEYPADFAAPRQPSLAQRALAGEFQVNRRRQGGAEPQINVGMGATPAQRTLEPAPAPAPAPAAAARPAAPAAAATAMAAPAPIAAPAAPDPRFANVTTLAPGTTNTYTGANGVTRRIDPGPVSAAAAA